MPLPNSPMSFTPLDPLAAAELNDIVENVEALADGSGLDNTSVGPSALATGAASASVATAETTASTSAADLATAGPSVTVTIGANGLALISVHAAFEINASTSAGQLYAVVSGATTVAAFRICYDRSPTATQSISLDGTYLLHSLTAGSNTFKLQYSVSGGTGTFSERRLSVIPL